MHSFLVAEREYGDYLGLEAKRLKIQVQESDPALPCPAHQTFRKISASAFRLGSMYLLAASLTIFTLLSL